MAGKAIEPIFTSVAARPGGHYSQAVRFQDTLFISGQLPVRADGRHSMQESFEVQAGIALDNLLAILKQAGGSAADLLKVTVYIVGIDNWPAFDQLYAGCLGRHRPARSVVPVPVLHHGYLIEIDAFARIQE